ACTARRSSSRAWPASPAAHHARVDHPLDLEVLHVSEAPGDFLRDVEARYRLADDRVVGRVLERRFRVELELEPAISHQLGVGDALAVAANPAVLDREIAPGDAELLRRPVEQRLARRRAGLPDLDAAEARRPQERSEEHTSELQSLRHLVCRLLLEKKKYGKAE